MGVSAVMGVPWQTAVVGALAGIVFVVVLARLLARRSSRAERTLVTFRSDR